MLITICPFTGVRNLGDPKRGSVPRVGMKSGAKRLSLLFLKTPPQKDMVRLESDGVFANHRTIAADRLGLGIVFTRMRHF